MLSSVDFPLPDGPNRTTTSPSRMSRSTLFYVDVEPHAAKGQSMNEGIAEKYHGKPTRLEMALQGPMKDRVGMAGYMRRTAKGRALGSPESRLTGASANQGSQRWRVMMPRSGSSAKGVRAVTSNAGHVPPCRGHVWAARTDGGARGAAGVR
jgi:hypothetical protein